MQSLHMTLHDDRPPVRLHAVAELCDRARAEMRPGTPYAQATRAMLDVVRDAFPQLSEDDAAYLIRMVR
jgi:hypothetical protein